MDNPDNPNNDARRPDGFERLGQEARVDFRMLKEGESYTSDQELALVSDIKDFRVAHHGPNGKPLPRRKLAELIGITESVLCEWLGGKYRGDRQRICRAVDEFLSVERQRQGRFTPRFTSIELTKKIVGVFSAVIRMCSMGAVFGEPGDGKSQVGRFFAKEREGCHYLCVSEGEGDRLGLAMSLCQALNVIGLKTFRERAAGIRSYISRHRNTVLIVDEAQRLTADGVEFLRSLHDLSDLDGCRNTPIILLGDQTFYRLISKARNGEPSPIRPQLVRRLYPVLDIERDCCDGGDGGSLFSEQDIARILRNERVRIVTNEGVRWLCSVANTRGQGSIGTAMALVRLALDISSTMPIGVEELNAALRMMKGPRGATELNEAAGGLLLRKIA